MGLSRNLAVACLEKTYGNLLAADIIPVHLYHGNQQCKCKLRFINQKSVCGKERYSFFPRLHHILSSVLGAVPQVHHRQAQDYSQKRPPR